MYYIIVSNEEKPCYIYVDDENIVVTTELEEATKFQEDSYGIDGVLSVVRKEFDNIEWVVSVVGDKLFGTKPRHVVTEKEILKYDRFTNEAMKLMW